MNPSAQRLTADFYMREDVVRVSQELLGKFLVTELDGLHAAGMIVETEAYRGPDDKACHAYQNRLTKRTRVMFESGGRAYIYLCYGIHHLFNVVTAPEGCPHAVLIRAVKPVGDLTPMLARRGMDRPVPRLTAGPGVMSQAMGIRTALNGISLLQADSPIWIEDRGISLTEDQILAGPRVGVSYAEECADWPWRFRVKGSRWTSHSI